MSIGEIVAINNGEKVYNDYMEVQKFFGMTPRDSVSFQESPWWTGKVGKEYDEKDYLCGKSLAAIAVMQGPSQLEELRTAYEQIKEKFGGRQVSDYDHKIAQHLFSFFRGTLFHEYLNPFSEKCINRKFAMKVVAFDKCLVETKFGEWFFNKLKIRIQDTLSTDIKSMYYTENFQKHVEAYIFDSPNEFTDLTARALARTTKLGMIVLGSLGAIHTAYRLKEGKDIKEEVAKTALEIATTVTAVGYLGAAGAKYGRTVGSMLGVTLGTLLGGFAPKAYEKIRQKS